MAANRAFLQQKWQKRHQYTVQECLSVNPADYLIGRKGLPEVAIEKLRSGATRRSYFVCPRCERLCGYLFVPPADAHSEAEPEWACRECHGLVYASQRYGRRHPLRLMGPPRGRAKRTLGRLLPSWYDENRLRQHAARGGFDLLRERFEYNAYGRPIRRVAQT